MKPFATFRFKSFGASRIGGTPCGPNRRSSSGLRLAQVAAKSGPTNRRARVKDSPLSRNKLRASGDSAGSSRLNKVGKHWLKKDAVIIRRDGKEICNPATAEGRAEYKWRIICMWVRQDGICCNCGEPLDLKEATFEHEDGRTAGKRNDAIALFDESGRWIRNINGASHLPCNSERGSRRTEIWHGDSFVIERESA